MSQRQEQLRVKMWEEIHKKDFEKSIAELQKIKVQMDTLNQDSEEYKKLKSQYDYKLQAAEAFFMKFQES